MADSRCENLFHQTGFPAPDGGQGTGAKNARAKWLGIQGSFFRPPGKLFGRTFGVQSLRGDSPLTCEVPFLRGADTGGAAVALAVAKIGLYPNASFLGIQNGL